MNDPRRALPSVNALLESPALRPLLAKVPRPLVADAARAAIAEARRDVSHAPSSKKGWAERIAVHVESAAQPSLRAVLNATGVVLHTNLGRAPLGDVAIDAIARAASGFSNLEYNLDTGARGSRAVHAVALLQELTGAAGAMVVNNCAAALVLVLNTLCAGRDAIISRGELVEIGGAFRVPDIMAKSGARLMEVGTTNRTHLDDYRDAISDKTGVLLKVHRSNFALEGFVAEVSARTLAEFAALRNIPVLEDLGSGLLMDLSPWGLSGEPTAADAVAAGASVVMMSGDKLLGGPQCGIILGNSAVIASLQKNPLARAVRVDKLTLAALEATLQCYRDVATARRDVPVIAMLTADPAVLRQRADGVASRLHDAGIPCQVVPSEGSVGGGAFPTAVLPSFAVALEGPADTIEAHLRGGRLPVITRTLHGAVHLDLRSIMPRDDEALAVAVLTALHPPA